jgi:hypothetical protein
MSHGYTASAWATWRLASLSQRPSPRYLILLTSRSGFGHIDEMPGVTGLRRGRLSGEQAQSPDGPLFAIPYRMPFNSAFDTSTLRINILPRRHARLGRGSLCGCTSGGGVRYWLDSSPAVQVAVRSHSCVRSQSRPDESIFRTGSRCFASPLPLWTGEAIKNVVACINLAACAGASGHVVVVGLPSQMAGGSAAGMSVCPS